MSSRENSPQKNQNTQENPTTVKKDSQSSATQKEAVQAQLEKNLTPSIPKDRKKVLRQHFFSTLYLSAFTFGGGYVIVSLLKEKFVDQLHWLDEDEMLDLVAIAQSSPGAIAVNGAIVVGDKLAGIPGVLCSVLGAIIPPFVILTVISFFYDAFKNNFVIQALLTGMKAGVSAVIISVVYDMASGIVKSRDLVLMCVMVLAFIANYFFKVNVIYIILICAALGAVRTIWHGHHGKARKKEV
jgi:chromate transporter